MDKQTQYFENTAMNLPMQAPSIDREDRIGESMEGGVEPAFWGLLASVAAPLVGSAVKAISGALS
ncbi:MAG: hypothetical protein HAW67_03845 [Endozoicomonadaceae bacterium]|nr:hypothetical protein [Endozoicomonadaceae bacterium]